jgi:hypothetical protein
MNKKVGIAIGIGLVVGTTILIVRHSLRKKGWTHNKFLASAFSVPYKPLSEGLDRKYQDMQEQQENKETSTSITFR